MRAVTGCAFTRSIGDNVAEQVGVFAEPEILTWVLGPNDKYCNALVSDTVLILSMLQIEIDKCIFASSLTLITLG